MRKRKKKIGIGCKAQWICIKEPPIPQVNLISFIIDAKRAAL
jgi:hypothetical protein